MKHTDILQRSWGILWRYRALWVFGVILALTASSAGTWFWAHDWERQEPYQTQVIVLDGETFWMALNRTLHTEVDRAERDINFALSESGWSIQVDLIELFWTLLAVCLTLFVLGKIAAYVSRVALIRMVDAREETGQQLRVGQGLRLGFSFSAVRFFLIDLLVFLFGVAVFVLLFGLATLFLMPWLGGSEPVVIVGAILTSTLFLLAIALMVVIGAALSLFKIFFRRACAIEGLGVIPAIRRGMDLMWRNKADIGAMFLIQLAIKMMWAPFSALIGLVALALALMVSGLSGMAVSGLSNLFTSGDTHIFLAVGTGLALFFLLLISPLVLMQGWLEIFLSSMWTLTFRDLRSLGDQEPAPAAEPPTLGAPSPA